MSETKSWQRVRGALAGAVVGTLAGMAAGELNLDTMVHGCDYLALVGAIVGALLGLTRARMILWIGAGALAAAVMVVSYTPLTERLIRPLERNDPPQKVDAIVILGADSYPGDVLSARGQDRVLRAVMLLNQGYANRVVITRTDEPVAVWAEVARRQIRQLGFSGTIDEVGPVTNTHDEAVTVADLAHKLGWTRVIIVSQSWHMRRSAALFAKVGLPVLCCPSNESSYDLVELRTAGDRLRGFRDWLHEAIGYRVYRYRGWI